MTYSSSLAMGRQQRFATRHQNTTSFRARPDKAIGPISNTIILIVLACIVGLLYLTQVTKTNAYSYKLNDLRQQQTALESQRVQLTVESARLQAQERVKASAVAKSLVSVAPADTISR